MTETNTVWYGKTQQASYLCKQNRNRWDFGIWRKGFEYSMLARSWIFQYYTPIAEEQQDIQAQGLCLWKNITERDRNGTPEAWYWFDRPLHRENVSQHLKPRNSNKTFRIYQHFSPLLFMRKLAFGSTWRSHQSRMIFTRIPWTLFACEEQSLFMFHGLISIKLFCWLGSLCKVFENQYRMNCKKIQLNPIAFRCEYNSFLSVGFLITLN